MKKVIKSILSVIKYLVLLVFFVYIAIVVVQNVTNNKASIGGYHVFTIVSESMVPKYQIGDILIVKSVDPSTLKVKDDITYQGTEGDFEGKVVTHKLIEITKDEKGNPVYITEGIANVMPDPEITGDQIVGKVVYKTKVLSLVNKLLSNKFVFFLVIFVPIFGYAIIKILKLINNVSDDEEDEKDEEEKED